MKIFSTIYFTVSFLIALATAESGVAIILIAFANLLISFLLAKKHNKDIFHSYRN